MIILHLEELNWILASFFVLGVAILLAIRVSPKALRLIAAYCEGRAAGLHAQTEVQQKVQEAAKKRLGVEERIKEVPQATNLRFWNRRKEVQS